MKTAIMPSKSASSAMPVTEKATTVGFQKATNVKLPDAMSVLELTDALQLHAVKGKQWHVQPSCALTGEGLREGLDWVCARCAGT